MERFIEICQETTYCMRYPQQDTTGWVLWIVWGLVICCLVGGLLGNKNVLPMVCKALLSPTRYRGRMGRNEFNLVYSALQVLRAILLFCAVLVTALFVHSVWQLLFCFVITLVLGSWLTLALYSSIVRRGHDFGFAGTESLLAYISRGFRRFRDNDDSDAAHTWTVLCNQKGNPYPNSFGSAPQENDYLIPPQDTQLLDVWEKYRTTLRK